MKTKGASFALLVLTFSILLLSPAASARKGVGILWITEKEIVNELSPHCIEYGVYNPWDEEVNAMLTVSEPLKPVVHGEESETKLIPGGTTHDKAQNVRLCFQVPKVYPADCLIGELVCEQTCQAEEVSYKGEVMVMEVKAAGTTGAMGSATALGVSVPLSLRVRCNPYARDWLPVYATVIVVVGAAICGVLYKKHRHIKKSGK